MQPSDANPLIRPDTPSLRYGRHTTPLFDDRRCPTRPSSPATSRLGGGRRGEPAARLLGCTCTIRFRSHPIICTKCQRLFHGHCNGLTRDQQKSPQGYVCGAYGSTNCSTIQPSQTTRSQPNNNFFCQTNIAVSNHPCSRLPQQILIPLQRRSTDHPSTEPTTPAEPPLATTVRKWPECKRCIDACSKSSRLSSMPAAVPCEVCQGNPTCSAEIEGCRCMDLTSLCICAEGHQPTGRGWPKDWYARAKETSPHYSAMELWMLDHKSCWTQRAYS